MIHLTFRRYKRIAMTWEEISKTYRAYRRLDFYKSNKQNNYHCKFKADII